VKDTFLTDGALMICKSGAKEPHPSNLTKLAGFVRWLGTLALPMNESFFKVLVCNTCLQP
jgi:hypothetical protein